MGIFIASQYEDDSGTPSILNELHVQPVITGSVESKYLRMSINAPILIDGNAIQNRINVSSILYNFHSLNSPVVFDTYNTNFAVIYSNQPMRNCFAFNSTVTFTGSPIFFNGFFSSCYNFNSDIIFDNSLPFYGTFASAFYGCHNFNHPNVTNFIFNTINNRVVGATQIFQDCWSFNQPITLADGNAIYLRASLSYICTNCISFNSPVNIHLMNTYRWHNLAGAFQNCFNLSADIKINFDPVSVTSLPFYNMLYGRSNAHRINVYCSNINLLYNSVASLVGPAVSWDTISGEDGIFNAVYNVYLYNNYNGW